MQADHNSVLRRHLPVRNGTTYVIAEIGMNHNGSLTRAIDLIGEAADAGADAAKFQNWVTEDFISDREQVYTYKSQGSEVTEAFYDLCKRNELQRSWLPELVAACRAQKIDFLSTPTTPAGVDDLVGLGVRVLKNGSDYLSNTPLISYMARSAPVVIISTGMAWEKDIDYAVKAVAAASEACVPVLLHCTSIYPTPVDQTNLNRMLALGERYRSPVGYSDHTEGYIAAVQAVTMGACVLEKHFTLRHDDPGPDHWFSVTPQELRDYVGAVRDAEQRLGSGVIAPAEGELQIAAEQRLSAVAAHQLPAGAVLSAEAVTFKKPGTGIHPAEIESFFGKRLKRAIGVDEVLVPEMFV